MPHILLVFSSATTAEFRVAGIPAAARAVHALAAIRQRNDISGCSILVGAAWSPSDTLVSECKRLAPHLQLTFPGEAVDPNGLAVNGEAFIVALARRDGSFERENVLPALFKARIQLPPESTRPEPALRELRRASRQILAATGKGGDGIVSRYINRPISRAISYQLLRFQAVTPWHASVGTALLGLMMAVALFFGGEFGLIAGALLFQAASIFDGVDGEIARATFRTSDQGATMDSVIDAFTNLAFITGITVNVGLAGDASSAIAGGIALVTLAAGLLLIGRHADALGEPMNFDVIKRHFRSRERLSWVAECLIHLTMRDFFAAACAIMIVAGFTHLLLLVFATIAVGWLVVTVAVLGRAKQRAVRNDQALSSVVTSHPS